MKLEEYAPNELLLTPDAIKNVAGNYSKQKEEKFKLVKDIEVIVTLMVNLLLDTFTLIVSFSQMEVWQKIIVILIIIGLGIYWLVLLVRIIYNAVKHRNNKTSNTLDFMLIEKAKNNLRYTAIIRIVYKNKNKVYYLTGSDYFLPHSNMDKTKEISEQRENIIQCLQDFNISEKDILEIKPVDNEVHFSIKPIHDNLQMNAFVFYDVSIKIQSRSKLISENSKRKWLTIDEMKSKPEALSSNKDVINLLEALPKPNESFSNVLGDIRIIWNITSKCPYNCAICATYDKNRTELSANDKLKVLNNICTAKDSIKSIDFAGGDPLHFDESINIIRAAIQQLGEDRVSVTTTGKSINETMTEKFTGMIKRCEITIDAAHSNLLERTVAPNLSSVSRNENDYCQQNISQVNTLLEYAESLTINVPIINDDLSDTEISKLTNMIFDIKEHNPNVDIDVTLLRLMPVGKMRQKLKEKNYSNYNPINVVNKIKKELEAMKIPYKLHCSLRALSVFENEACCNMLERKIGIDCAGNVFACAWGGYVNDKVSNNPFYLGNLTQVSLHKILIGESKTQQYRDILSEINIDKKRKFCSVVSYCVGGKAFENKDPLAK